jgi:hypothetical protein
MIAFTSRGGVGCCWVNPLIMLAAYENYLAHGDPKSRTHSQKVKAQNRFTNTN